MKIVYNAAQATITGIQPDFEKSMVECCLKWINEKNVYLNYSNRFKPYYKSKDINEYCYNFDTKSFPTGLLSRVLVYLDRFGIEPELECLINLIDADETITTPDWMYQHQIDLIHKNFLLFRRVITRIPVGGGKTTSIAEIAKKFPTGHILIVLHEIEFIKDLIISLQEKLNVPVGMIGGGVSNPQRITVASGQSLSRSQKHKDYLSTVDILIFDECHHYANKTGVTISDYCKNTSYRLGLSATPGQPNGSWIVLEGVIGPMTLFVTDDVMCKLGVTHKPLGMFITLPRIDLNLPVPWGKSKPDRNDTVLLGIIRNRLRNQIAVNIVKSFKDNLENKGYVLIVVKDVKNGHGELIKNMLNEIGIESISVTGKDKDKGDVIRAFKSGKVKVLVATRILNEAHDIPRLELVINLGGGDGSRDVQQIKGRSVRLDNSGEKIRALYYDFIDKEEFYLERNSMHRLAHFNACHPDCGHSVSADEAYKSTNPNYVYKLPS